MPDLTLQTLEQGIAVLRMNRPARLNAFTDDAVSEFTQMLERLATDASLRVLILTGEGRGFCAGFDLTLADQAPLTAELGEVGAWAARQEAFAGIVTRLRALRAPVIAAVNGPATGAGLGLALACDIRIAAPSAVFNAAFVKVGMSSCDIGVSWLLPRCIGMSRAFEIMLTGRMVGAIEAERIGLVSSLATSDDELLACAVATARSIADCSALGVWMTKRGAWANLEAASLQAAIELENRTQIMVRGTGDLARAGAALTARKRPDPH
jgi:enoyl-CoA hydratase